MPSIEYKDNIDRFIMQLEDAGHSLQQSAVKSINKAAHRLHKRYISTLRKKLKHVRNPQYTLGATKTLEATAVRSSGELRELKNINAIVGVRNMSGGGEHYLAKLERGYKKRGNRNTGGKVAIPLLPARGGDVSRPVVSRFRLSGGKAPYQFQSKLKGIANPREQMAALRDMAKSGKIQPGAYQSELVIISVKKRRVEIIRSVEKKSVEIKRKPSFEQSVDSMKSTEIVDDFIKEANRLVKGK